MLLPIEKKETEGKSNRPHYQRNEFLIKHMNNSGTMKEAYYYGFLPSKAEEEAANACNTPFQTTREVVKIRDLRLATFNSPWQTQKVVTDADDLAGMLADMQMRAGGTQVQPCDMGIQRCDWVVLAKHIQDFTL